MLQDHRDAGPTARRIAGLSPDDVPVFITTSAAERQLHVIVRDLNDDLQSRSKARRAAAAAALAKLGFL